MRSYQDQPSGTIDALRCSRREAPEPERRLLRAIKAGFPELKWRHQSPIGPFRVDLLCSSERLVIEVDGDTLVGREDHDAGRTRYLEREGYRVIRFGNVDVMENLDGVLGQISLSLWRREEAHRVSDGKGEGDFDRKGDPV